MSENNNALGNLFTEMAESIRGGLGYIGKMKPITFPEKVDEIVALLEYYKNNSGGSGSEESDSPLKFTSGSFRPTADRTRMTIEHGLGCMPDFVMVYQAGIADYSTMEEFCADFPILFTWGFKSSFNAGFLTGLNFPGWGFTQKQYGIDNVPEEGQDNGFIYCPDESTFQVGMVSTSETGSIGLASGATYNWIAVTGMGSVTEPVVQALTITENGTYTAPEGVDGFNPITVNVDPSKVTILREQQFDGFVMDSNFGAFSPGFVSPALFVLKDGETYHVVWDGEEKECVAYSFPYSGMTMVAIGNGTSLGLPGNGEKFLITYNATMNNTQLFSIEQKDSHTVGIWQKVTVASDDVRYVTFKSYDGSVEYGKKAVAVGDDCADPIARGIFATPTRESDVQYNYTFYDWATEPNGGADANWNKTVTEDKTVYANFSKAVRYYTITYYDSDGTTVLETESLAYGSMPSYQPSKDGYIFNGWTADVAEVTGDSSYTAKWTSAPTFSTASWAEIKAVADAGQAKSVYSVGDKRTETITYADGTTETVEFEIMDLDGNVADGEKIALIATHVLDTPVSFYKSNPGNSFTYVSANCDMAKYVQNELINYLPTEMQEVLMEFGWQDGTVYGGYVAGMGAKSKLFIPSPRALFGKEYNASSTNDKLWAALFKNGKTKVCTKRDGTAVECMTMGSYSYSNKVYPVVIDTSGAMAYKTQYNLLCYIRLMCFI